MLRNRIPRLWGRSIRQISHRLRLFLDLDDCLINSELINPLHSKELQSKLLTVGIESAIITLKSSPQQSTYCVAFRPGLFHFLEEACQFSDLYVFSAGTEQYVEQIVKKIDAKNEYFKKYWGRNMVTWNLFVEDQFDFRYTKDLAKLADDFHPQRSVLIDNYVTNMIYQPYNGILTESSQIMQKGSYYLLSCERNNRNPYLTENGEQLQPELNPLASILEDLKHIKDLDDVRPYLSQKYQIVRRLKSLSKYELTDDWFQLVQSYDDHPRK